MKIQPYVQELRAAISNAVFKKSDRIVTTSNIKIKEIIIIENQSNLYNTGREGYIQIVLDEESLNKKVNDLAKLKLASLIG